VNEAATRAKHIDPALQATGWGVAEGSRIRREYPITPGPIEGRGRRGKALTADYFSNEEALHAIWSAPDPRQKLLQGLAEKGFGHEQLAEMQRIIGAADSDLFDVLAHVAYAVPPVTREVRAAFVSFQQYLYPPSLSPSATTAAA
jgi:hypothetical protein